MLTELKGNFVISVAGNFMRNGCHVGLVGANPTWLKNKTPHMLEIQNININPLHAYISPTSINTPPC